MDTIVEQSEVARASEHDMASPWTMLTAFAIALTMIGAYKLIDLIAYGGHLL